MFKLLYLAQVVPRTPLIIVGDENAKANQLYVLER